MKPANGSYRLHSNPTGTPPQSYDMRFDIDDEGGHASFGDFDWDEDHDWFKHKQLDIYIRFFNSTQFVAIVNAGAGAPTEKSYSGTY